MDLIPGKRYRPEFTQLPFGFINDNTDLQTIIREKGLQYLAMYIAIQDRMANHTEDDFTLSYREAIAETKAFLQQFSKGDAEIKILLDDLIEVGIVVRRDIVNEYTNTVEQRYCIPSVADTLEASRESWYSKIINPIKQGKVDKDKVNKERKELKKIEDDIRAQRDALQRHRSKLTIELGNSTEECDRELERTLNGQISEFESKLSDLYTKRNILKSKINKLLQGGDEDAKQVS